MGFALAGAPQAGHFVRVLDDELAVIPLPGDDVVVFFFPQQLQDEVPQLDLPGSGAGLGLVGPFRKGKPCKRERVDRGPENKDGRSSIRG